MPSGDVFRENNFKGVWLIEGRASSQKAFGIRGWGLTKGEC